MRPVVANVQAARPSRRFCRWLRRRARTDACWSYATGLAAAVLGAVILCLDLFLVNIFVLPFDCSLATVTELFSGTLAAVQAFVILVVIVLFLGALCYGNHRLVPQYLGKVPHSSTSETEIALGIIFSGPWCLNAAWQLFRKAWRLSTLHADAIAKVLAVLMFRGRRVSFLELARLVPECNAVEIFPQLRDIDGIVFLTREPAGVSLTEELRAELWDWLPGTDDEVEIEPPPYEPATEQPFEEAAAEEPPPSAPPTEYELLGVSPNATTAEIKAAYRKCLKECHPDRFATFGAEIQQLAEERTKAVIAAYEKLMARASEQAEA